MGYDEHWRRSCKNGRVIFGPRRACSEQKSFLKAENLIGDKWKETLTEEMILAGKAEREAALAEGKLDEGIPTIDVVVDGGWSTRSHQHRYTAN